MAELVLVIGNKRYSSWSLRPWLLLRQAGLAFREVVVPLYQDGHKDKILAYSPAGKVPILIDGPRKVWDSLAICETVAEMAPERALWPADPVARAHARAISAEMHSGFQNLRSQFGMNVAKDRPTLPTPETAADIARIRTIWREARSRFGQNAGGPFLFGAFGVADAMYAPVVTRMRSYGVALDGAEAAYADAIWALPALQDWIEAGKAETWRLPQWE